MDKKLTLKEILASRQAKPAAQEEKLLKPTEAPTAKATIVKATSSGPSTTASIAPDTKEAKEKEVVVMKHLAAVAMPYNSKPLQVSRKVAAPKNSSVIPVVCEATGITIEIIAPTIPGVALEYTNPLAKYSNVKALISQGSSYLEKLDTQVLAGIWLTSYRHYNLIRFANSKLNATVLNAILRTCGSTILINSLELINHINTKNAAKLPAFSLDYTTHKDSQSLAPTMQEYTRLLRGILFPTLSVTKAPVSDEEATIYKIKKTKLSSAEKEHEEHFIANRREGKEIIKSLTESRQVPAQLLNKIRTSQLFVGKNLFALPPTVRAKIVDKLNSFNSPDAKRLAVIIELATPYESVDSSLERASDFADVPMTKAKMSLSELLAKRLNKDSQAASATQEQSDSLDNSAGLEQPIPESISEAIEDISEIVDSEEDSEADMHDPLYVEVESDDLEEEDEDREEEGDDNGSDF